MVYEMRFEIYIDDQEALDKAKTFICGFHGLGETGYIVTRELIDRLPNCKRIAVIASTGAPPFISVEDQSIRMPFEIYAVDEIAIFIPRIQPYRHVQVAFSEKLSDWVRVTFERAVLIGGVDKRLQENESTVRYIPTRSFIEKLSDNEKLSTELKDNLLDSGLFVTGPLAIMLGFLDLHNFPALGVLAYAEREHPDPEGAANAIKALKRFLDLDIVVDDLVENAKMFEKEIKARLELEKKHSDDPQSPGTYT